MAVGGLQEKEQEPRQRKTRATPEYGQPAAVTAQRGGWSPKLGISDNSGGLTRTLSGTPLARLLWKLD